MRFLHTADWQIGRQYPRFPADDAAALAEARFTAVSRIAALAHEGGYTAVLVAGDVFDAQTVSERSIRRLFNAMQGYNGPWVLIPGNHDAALVESVWSRAKRLGVIPDNVHVALQAQVIEFPDLGFAVLPAPLTQRQTATDLTAWFDLAQTTAGLLRIGLAHGSVQGILAQDIDSPNPIAPDRAQRAQLDYLALGDWHGTRQINEFTWYSGTPEPDRFKSNGAGQLLSIEIAAAGLAPQVSVLPIASYEWLSWQEHVAVDSDIDVLLNRLAQLPENTVLELQLTGHTDLAGQQRLQAGLASAEAHLRSVQYDLLGLRFLPTDADIIALRADGYVGEVLVQLQDYDQNQQMDGARDALVILADILRDVQHTGDAS
ncbi:DNA repair exonuclease [Alcaligenaceae bacterium]|nr:DNA repair exonuclease [Alcaligenaceae bacterium]